MSISIIFSRSALLIAMGTLAVIAIARAQEPATKPSFESFKMGGLPVPIDATKLDRVTDGMTLGDIVAELGPGWMSDLESAGIITWVFTDNRQLRVWPSKYKADERIRFEGDSGRSRMWVEKRPPPLQVTTAPATTRSS